MDSVRGDRKCQLHKSWSGGRHWRIMHMMGQISQLVTSLVAPKQRDTVGGRCLFFWSHLILDNTGCLAVCHIMARAITSTRKTADCQLNLPDLVINYTRQNTMWVLLVICFGNISLWHQNTTFWIKAKAENDIQSLECYTLIRPLIN